MRNPPDENTYGATTDNQNNCIVWMRPDVLDDVINEVKHGSLLGLEILIDIQNQYVKDMKEILSNRLPEPPAPDPDYEERNFRPMSGDFGGYSD